MFEVIFTYFFFHFVFCTTTTSVCLCLGTRGNRERGDRLRAFHPHHPRRGHRGAPAGGEECRVGGPEGGLGFVRPKLFSLLLCAGSIGLLCGTMLSLASAGGLSGSSLVYCPLLLVYTWLSDSRSCTSRRFFQNCFNHNNNNSVPLLLDAVLRAVPGLVALELGRYVLVVFPRVAFYYLCS